MVELEAKRMVGTDLSGDEVRGQRFGGRHAHLFERAGIYT